MKRGEPSYQIVEKVYCAESYHQKRESIKSKLRKLSNIRETDMVFRREDNQGKECINQYLMQETLGEGSYAEVRRATAALMGRSTQYAIKIIDKRRIKKQRHFQRDHTGKLIITDGMLNIIREITIMKKLRHPNIISLHEVIDDTEDDMLYIVLDYAQKGEKIRWDDQQLLFTTQEQYTESTMRHLVRGLVKGLHYIHVHGIVHRDIKPANVLFDHRDNPLLADFGVSAILQDPQQKMEDTQGTDYFMSPESHHSGHDGKVADVWALAVTLYAFAYLRLPFLDTQDMEFIDVITTQPVTFPEQDYGQGFQEMLADMLEKKAQDRACLRQISRHGWVNRGEQVSLEEELDDIEAMAQLEEQLQEEDIQQSVIPLNRVLFMKQVVRVFRSRVGQAKEGKW